MYLLSLMKSLLLPTNFSHMNTLDGWWPLFTLLKYFMILENNRHVLMFYTTLRYSSDWSLCNKYLTLFSTYIQYNSPLFNQLIYLHGYPLYHIFYIPYPNICDSHVTTLMLWSPTDSTISKRLRTVAFILFIYSAYNIF